MSDIDTAIAAHPAAESPSSTKRTSEVKKRVTCAIPEVLDQALELFCNATSQQKNEVLAEALAAYLAEHRARLQEALDLTHHNLTLFITASAHRRTR